jgi:hypothetical protein
MKRLRTFIVAAMALFVFGLPQVGYCQRVIYVVCWKYVVDQNCNKCSDYFSVQTEDEAIRKCKQRGYAQPNYFPGVGAIRAWVLSHCTCGDD